MCQEKDEIAKKVHAIIDKFAERGLRSLAVAIQVFQRTYVSLSFPFLLKGKCNKEKKNQFVKIRYNLNIR